MSSTRHAKDPSVFHQSRFASSGEIEAGLNAALVARRCSVLPDPADRALIYWLHLVSHQPGGLNAVAEKLVADYRAQLGTEQMVKIGKRAGQKYTADEVKQIREGLPYDLSQRFPLRGEIPRDIRSELRHDRLSLQARRARELTVMREADEAVNRLSMIEDGRQAELERQESSARDEASKNPNSYPVDDFISVCCDAALLPDETLKSGEYSLADELRVFCLNPACEPRKVAPWYFFNLEKALRDYMRDWIAQRASGVVVTELGKQVHDMLDYTLHSSSMTLLVGSARRGKSFAARSWCERHPGQARFVEVPTGNDDTSFFRALARGLGLGNFSQYKAIELRERVESVLLTGDILVSLDEAQRLWPEVNLRSRCGFPKRISWVMSMVNQGVSFCLIATPQFFDRQKLSDQITGWNSAQFIGRLHAWKQLPDELSVEDLTTVAKSILPEADNKTLRALAIYAQTSARYLAAIDAIASRARYDAARAGRKEITTEDVRKAMSESVIPSDSMLVCALEPSQKSKAGHRPLPPLPEAPLPAPAAVQPDPIRDPETPALTAGRRGISPVMQRASITEFSTA